MSSDRIFVSKEHNVKYDSLCELCLRILSGTTKYHHSTSVTDVNLFSFCLLLFYFLKETDSSRLIEGEKMRRK